MKKLSIFVLLFGLLLISSCLAYEVNVESSSNSEIVLSFAGLNNVDIKISDLKATVETSTVSDTYLVDKKLSVQDNKIFLTVDITPIMQDYPSNIESITISGYLETDGVQEEFAKKVFYRSSGINFQAPSLDSPTLIYWIVGIVVLLVIFAIVLTYKKPKKKAKRKKKSKKKKKI